ncbi:MAG TPA: MBL fold metallo-hydrolase [Pyrinomonadaceae bacterium]|jgi:glyoxylase-like metal-dependent hydrolase (beta-lactamase superfamily II)/ferredoxin|nr:MBL fold metallo-hydrolase [Pyrinomonadaceae bacterium]
MASVAQRLPQNVAGDFYVDATCIDCDACRQIAPATFRDHGEQSSVYRQPETEDETLCALMALVACPTASIGTLGHHNTRAAVDAYPARLSENVYFCGFTSEASFGAWSYLIVRPEAEGGNVLVDSPRFASQLVKRIEALGGVRQMFLTHADDIADHAKFAARFGCTRIMHAADGARARGVERIVEGEAEVALDAELTVIPVPGHTRGHMLLLYRDKYLFTGDHLAWSPSRETLTAFRSVAWYSWREQTRSMEKLLSKRFEWVLPGHGRIHSDSAEGMQAHLRRCIEWMRETT